MKQVVINQAASLGDILFIEPIYRHYHEQGYTVIAPVNDDLYWIREYIPYVIFRKKSQFKYSYETVEQPEDGRLHLPLRFAHPLLRGYDLHYGDERENWMRDKYLYLGLDENLWRTMQFARNKEKEDLLFVKLGIEGEYNFVNEHFGGSFEKVPITINNDLPCVHLKKMDGFTLLDWLGVIEKATNIYTVETSIMWVIEALPMAAKEFNLYPRYPFLEHTKYITSYLQKNWKQHEITNL
jgi:hypothetical protein